MRQIKLGAVIVALGAGLFGTTPAHAQMGLGDVGMASSLGAGIDAAAVRGMPSASQLTKRVTSGQSPEMPRSVTMGPGAGGPAPGGAPGAAGPGATGGSGTSAAGSYSTSNSALHWSTATGQDFLNELLAGHAVSARSSRSSRVHRRHRVQSVYHRRRHLSRAERRGMLVAKYNPAAPGWLMHYIPDDRYKLTSGVWQFVSTETDRFYYAPSAPGVLRQDPNRVIGFHTWQDAMIAGYRPDPASKPEPGAQFAHLAHLTHGHELNEYVEYVYAGQVTPQSFDSAYKYLEIVERLVNSRKYTRPMMGDTISAAIAAILGEGPPPVQVGVEEVAQTTSTNGTPGAPGAPGGPGGPPGVPGAPPGLPGAIPGEQSAGAPDKREGEFSNFSNKAGNLAAPPGAR